MTNIAINTYCNQNCPYCYIDQLKNCKIKTMSVDDYCSLLEWFVNTEESQIGITGGEPTLHPNFDLILKETDRYCRNLNAVAIIYTNGIRLKEYLPYVTDNFLIDINYIGDQEQLEVIDFLHQQEFFQHEQAILKCPLYLGKKRYRDFWDIVEKYQLKLIETCITLPYADYNRYRYDKERYYNLMKPIFLNFCKDAINHNCVISVGCPEIPMCYFTKEEQEILEQACDLDTLGMGYCNPTIEILPDWTASLCICSYNKSVDIRPFYSMVELERYLTFKQTMPRIEGNCLGRCAECPEHELFQCQGGCLGFADV